MSRLLRKPAAANKGATSVLVIFMMMILVTLGTFAITSANANYKFSQRAIDWNAMYYNLDAGGEEFLAELDGRLADAEAMAYDYVMGEKFQTTSQMDIPDWLQTDIYSGYAADSLQNDYIGDVFVKIYMFYADKYLSEMALENSGMEVYASGNDPFIDTILTQISVVSDRPGDERNSLVISVWAEPVEYVASENNGSLVLVRANDSLRYTIEDWYEYQEPIYEEPTEQLWDGKL